MNARVIVRRISMFFFLLSFSVCRWREDARATGRTKQAENATFSPRIAVKRQNATAKRQEKQKKIIYNVLLWAVATKVASRNFGFDAKRLKKKHNDRRNARLITCLRNDAMILFFFFCVFFLFISLHSRLVSLVIRTHGDDEDTDGVDKLIDWFANSNKSIWMETTVTNWFQFLPKLLTPWNLCVCFDLELAWNVLKKEVRPPRAFIVSWMRRWWRWILLSLFVLFVVSCFWWIHLNK